MFTENVVKGTKAREDGTFPWFRMNDSHVTEVDFDRTVRWAKRLEEKEKKKAKHGTHGKARAERIKELEEGEATFFLGERVQFAVPV